MADKKIDIVVPVYKAKETLTRLLASVVMQSMSQSTTVYLVQDSDSEDYSAILDPFSKILDIRLISTAENVGPGKARRIGMQQGNSKYVVCIDADDTLHNPFALQELYNAIESNGLDAVNSIFLEQIDDTQFTTHENDWVWVFGKIYNRNFLENNKIEMNDSRANEDVGFNTVVRATGKVGYLPSVTYIWHYKEGSITRVDNSIYNFTGNEGWLYNMSWAISNMERLKLAEEVMQKEVAKYIINTYCWYLEYARGEDKRYDINKFLEWVRKFVQCTYLKHKPTEKQLEESYKAYSSNKELKNHIPSKTLKEYIELVSGENK